MIITRNAAHLIAKIMDVMDTEQMEDAGFTEYEIEFAQSVFAEMEPVLVEFIGDDYLDQEVL